VQVDNRDSLLYIYNILGKTPHNLVGRLEIRAINGTNRPRFLGHPVGGVIAVRHRVLRKHLLSTYNAWNTNCNAECKYERILFHQMSRN